MGRRLAMVGLRMTRWAAAVGLAVLVLTAGIAGSIASISNPHYDSQSDRMPWLRIAVSVLAVMAAAGFGATLAAKALGRPWRLARRVRALGVVAALALLTLYVVWVSTGPL